MKPLIHINAKFVTTGMFSKELLRISHLYATAIMIYYKNLWASILWLLLLKEMMIGFIFGAWLMWGRE